MSKNRKDRAYDKGYQHGKEGGMLDDFVQKNKDLVPLPDHPDESSYDGGYVDGAKDRDDEDNSHYQGGNYKAKQRGKDYDRKYYPDDRYYLSAEPKKKYHSKYTPPSDNSLQALLVKAVAIIALICAAAWLADNIVIPLLIINIASVALIWGFFKRNWRNYLNIISFLGAVIIILDYNYGGETKKLPENVAFFADTIPFFFYLNITAGLVAAYFLIRDLLNRNNPPQEGQNELSKKNLIIAGSLFLVGVATVCLQNYLGGDISKNANSTDKIESSSIPSSNTIVQPSYSPLSYLKQYNGKYAANVNLFDTDPLKSRLIKLLGDKYKVFNENMGMSVPIKITNDTLFFSGCLPNHCGSDEAAISILFNTDNILVGILSSEKYRLYSEKQVSRELPQELKTWFDVKIAAIQNKLERLHEYNYQGTVVSVEEQGNAGFVYLNIKTPNGEDRSFLINNAKVFKNDTQVNLKLLTIGMNVGVIGGDEAKRIDIINRNVETTSQIPSPTQNNAEVFALESREYQKITGTCSDYVLIEFSNDFIKLKGIEYPNSTDVKYVENYYKSSTEPNKFYINNNQNGAYIMVLKGNTFNFVSTERFCTFIASIANKKK